MRTMLKINIPVESGNKAIQDGSIEKIVGKYLQDLKPEAAYFYTEHGQRTAFMVFDMKDTTQIPALAEPLYLGLNANVEFFPVMNAEDLKAGLEAWAKSAKELVGTH